MTGPPVPNPELVRAGRIAAEARVRLAPVSTDKPASWHFEKMAEFTALKALVGEPSPHMRIVVHLTDGLPIAERLWRGGCYLNAYSVGTAEKLWEAWPHQEARRQPELMAQWITDHWPGFHTRTERRCVRTPGKFIRAQLGILEWIQHGVRELLLDGSIYRDRQLAYDRWWTEANRIPYFGRYINIRLLEYVNRVMPQLGLDLYDIRAIGGWSPIRALTLLRPQDSAILLTGQAEPVNRIAEEVLAELRQHTPMSYYVFAAMLCEYREAYEDRHQYPGRTHDQELAYSSSGKFGFWETPPRAIWDARRALFPPEALGELNGWSGVRHELSAWLRDRGENWSDLCFRYVGEGKWEPRGAGSNGATAAGTSLTSP